MISRYTWRGHLGRGLAGKQPNCQLSQIRSPLLCCTSQRQLKLLPNKQSSMVKLKLTKRQTPGTLRLSASLSSPFSSVPFSSPTADSTSSPFSRTPNTNLLNPSRPSIRILQDGITPIQEWSKLRRNILRDQTHSASPDLPVPVMRPGDPGLSASPFSKHPSRIQTPSSLARVRTTEGEAASEHSQPARWQKRRQQTAQHAHQETHIQHAHRRQKLPQLVNALGEDEDTLSQLLYLQSHALSKEIGLPLGQNSTLPVTEASLDTFDRHRKKARKEIMVKDLGSSRKKSRIWRQNGIRKEDDEYKQQQQEAEWRPRKKKNEWQQRTMGVVAAAQSILLPEFISVTNLSTALRVKPHKFLMQLGELGFDDIALDSIMTGETAALISQEYGFEPRVQSGESVDLRRQDIAANRSELPERPPIVTIMGHVDHGKTTMLDRLRKSSVAAHEHGGITQHIGAFAVQLTGGRKITFLDTPGHAAFLTMRQRGANVTDIVILVVAADDSVKPQTLEALKHARAANVPIIVAINKIDKDEARVEQVKSDLARHGVEIEDFGGDVQVVCVSARTGQGMEDLEENVLALAEMLDVRAEADGLVEGWVLESSIKEHIGRAASILVKRGTLRKGDVLVAGTVWARVRMLRNEVGAEIDEASPGTPVEVLGWKVLPDAGDEVLQAPTESRAKDATAYRLEVRGREKAANENEQRLAELARVAGAEGNAITTTTGKGATSLSSSSYSSGPSETPSAEEGPVQVNFIVKGDVMGSVEAVVAAVMEIGNHEVQPRVLQSAPGAVTESDVEHAATTGSVIISFHAAPTSNAIRNKAKDTCVPLLEHSVIYHLIDEVKSRLSKHLAPIVSTRVLGEAEVLQVFPINIRGRVFRNVAGCRVRNGLVTRSALYRVFRNSNKIFDGKADSLKQGKKDTNEIRKGTECGISFDNWSDMEVGDTIQAYEEVLEKRSL